MNMEATRDVTSPMLRYHGGKWKIAPAIIKNFPPHDIYVEPFGGGASVLLRKPRCPVEIYNDLDSDIVNLFKVYRDNGAELQRRLLATPYARQEYIEAFNQEPMDAIERARRTVVKSLMGFGSSAVTSIKASDSGFRSYAKPKQRVAVKFANYAEECGMFIQRMRGVIVENRDVMDLIPLNDGSNVLFYVDPPYVKSTRGDNCDDYRFEMDDSEHAALALILHNLKAKVCISGYRCQLYDRLYRGWTSLTFEVNDDSRKPREEVIWMNYPPPNRRLL